MLYHYQIIMWIFLNQWTRMLQLRCNVYSLVSQCPCKNGAMLKLCSCSILYKQDGVNVRQFLHHSLIFHMVWGIYWRGLVPRPNEAIRYWRGHDMLAFWCSGTWTVHFAYIISRLGHIKGTELLPISVILLKWTWYYCMMSTIQHDDQHALEHAHTASYIHPLPAAVHASSIAASYLGWMLLNTPMLDPIVLVVWMSDCSSLHMVGAERVDNKG